MIQSLSNADLVLIIDDDETVLNVTQQIVMRCGFDTTVASSGLEGLSKLEQQMDEIKCILLDMSMPHMDGASTFDEIVKIAPQVPVILVSGYTEQDLSSRFRGEKPYRFLQKPFSIGDLDELLHDAVKHAAGHSDVGRYSGPIPVPSVLTT